jgi:hypothetical protein
MNINALTSLPSAATLVPSAVASNNRGFAALLQRVAPVAEDAKRRQEAEEAAAGLVSNALILPILKQVRRSSMNTQGVFSAGIGEKTFGPEFDMQIADRIAHSPQLGIRKALADRMMKRGPQTKAAPHKEVDVHG